MLCSFAPIAAALTMQASGAIIIQDDFSGDSGTNLNGQAADVGGTWTADSLFKADGSYTTASNFDRSGYIALPSALQLNTVYTLAVTLDSQSGTFFYAGLHSNTVDTSRAAQIQNPGSLSLEFDAINNADGINSKLHTLVSNGTGTGPYVENRYFTGTYSTNLSMVINTGSDLSTASVEFFINGVSQGTINHDVTGLDTLVIGNELGSGGTDIGSITFSSEAIPEPSSAALLGLAGVALVLRRRR